MDGLQVKFQKQLKNFPLCIQFEAEGGCVGILGASGCGKSMTLKTIAGNETPDTGRYLWADVNYFTGNET